MRYEKLLVLIPSHSLEDFPTELGEEDAASLLNAFAVLWHPALLAEARSIPMWHRADDPLEARPAQLVIVPTASSDWVPHGWVETARDAGAGVVAGVSERREMLELALDGLDRGSDVDSDLAGDFLALGTCHLQTELLARQMHYFSNVDEVHLQREAVAAADAALAGDSESARMHLKACFEVCLEARERFYPVDCYLIDLCMLIPSLADEDFDNALVEPRPINVLVTAEDLERVGHEQSALIDRLRDASQAGTVDLIGGEWRERPSPLLPIESVLWDFVRGRDLFTRLIGRPPRVWGRRQFGLSTLMPDILNGFGYRGALHLVLDDGIYPDAEQSKIRWEGCGGKVVDAITRIPLAADSATSFLRFAGRLSESMENDSVAALVLARWPKVETPWFGDLQRMHGYAPVLGRFATLTDFFENTDEPGRLSSYHAGEYLTPALVQSVARQEADAISRYVEHADRRIAFDAGCWYERLAALLSGESFDTAVERESEARIEQAALTANDSGVEQVDAWLSGFVRDAAGRLADVVMPAAARSPGVLLLNPLSFARTVSVDLPDFDQPPAVSGPVKNVQFDGKRKCATVELPAAGYTWIPAVRAAEKTPETRRVATAEELVLRNDWFEVYINAETGGIAEIKQYGRSPNRLSQQLAFRFARDRTIKVGTPPDEDRIKTPYSAMRFGEYDLTCDGPAMGEIVTIGEIVDQADNSVLSGFRQTVRVWRSRPIVELDVELDIQRMPEGDPWSNYYAARFAWNDSDASLTRSVQQGAHGFQGERFESPHYLEIASDRQRTTVLNMGLPFHRKTGPRMVDTLLVVAGESRRRFRFVIAVDVSYPMLAALDAMCPVAVVPTATGPTAIGSTAIGSTAIGSTAIGSTAIGSTAIGSTAIGSTATGPTAGQVAAPARHTAVPARHTAVPARQAAVPARQAATLADGKTGWFFHVDAKNVQLTRLLDVSGDRADEAGGARRSGCSGVAVRLVETEGRRRPVRLRCFRQPRRAWQRDFDKKQLNTLEIDEDCVMIEMTPYEIADVEIQF